MSVKNKPKGLGRGLNAIFDLGTDSTDVKEHLMSGNRPESGIYEIDIERISPNEDQPRKQFDAEALQELADSISHLGLIQPITVRKESSGDYTIISGERRYRAAQLAGLKKLPVYIREADDAAMLEMALVENIQRQDLNAMEIAISLQRLTEECQITQELLADRVGKKRSTVSNYIRLLKLPAEIQYALKQDLITMGHARALITVESKDTALSLLSRIVEGGLSVRQTEELIQRMGEKKSRPELAEEPEYPESYGRLVEQLERVLGQDISIRRNAKGKGKIVIGFNGDEDIEALLQKLERLTKNEF